MLLFSEHWLEQECASFVKIDGYNLVSLFSRKDMKHGGVCIYSSENSFRDVPGICAMSVEGVIEFCAVSDNNRKVFILCLYRRGIGSYEIFMECFEQVLEFIYCNFSKYKVIIAGDFNVNFLDQENHRVRQLGCVCIDVDSEG